MCLVWNVAVFLKPVRHKEQAEQAVLVVESATDSTPKKCMMP